MSKLGRCDKNSMDKEDVGINKLDGTAAAVHDDDGDEADSEVGPSVSKCVGANL